MDKLLMFGAALAFGLVVKPSGSAPSASAARPAPAQLGSPPAADEGVLAMPSWYRADAEAEELIPHMLRHGTCPTSWLIH